MIGWPLFLFSILMLIMLRKRTKPKWIWIARIVFAALIGLGLAETGVGRWLGNSVLRPLFDWFGRLADNSSGAAILGVLTLALLLFVCLAIFSDKKAPKLAMVGLILLPVMILATAGPISAGDIGGSQIITAIGAIGQQLLGSLPAAPPAPSGQ